MMQTKKCNTCGQEKPVSEFRLNKPTKDGQRKPEAKCRLCLNDRLRENSTPEQNLRRNLKRGYNITLEQYEEMLAAQEGVCAICGNEDTGRIGARFSVDHDHLCCPGDKSCGECIRGLLCNHCNNVLGRAKDNVKILLSAIEYLEANHRKSRNQAIISKSIGQ